MDVNSILTGGKKNLVYRKWNFRVMENTCKEGKEAGIWGHFERLKTIQLIVSSLMECVRGGKQRYCTRSMKL